MWLGRAREEWGSEGQRDENGEVRGSLCRGSQRESSLAFTLSEVRAIEGSEQRRDLTPCPLASVGSQRTCEQVITLVPIQWATMREDQAGDQRGGEKWTDSWKVLETQPVSFADRATHEGFGTKRLQRGPQSLDLRTGKPELASVRQRGAASWAGAPHSSPASSGHCPSLQDEVASLASCLSPRG